MMKKEITKLFHSKKFLVLFLIFIFDGSLGCSIGTDKSDPLLEKSVNQLQLNSEGSSYKQSFGTLSEKAMLAKGLQNKLDSHPQIDDNKTRPREIIIPSEVEGKWKAVNILIRNKQNEERGKILIAELGTSFILEGSELKVTVGPFLPNFMMDKMNYTSMGNEELNPAVQLIVEESGKIIYKGWAFQKFPSMYAFEHQIFSFELLGAISTVIS